jgi:DNA-binding NtrC family response regulator
LYEDIVKHSPFTKLKKVSGRLRKLLTLHDEPVSSEPHLPRLLVVDDEESIRFSMSEYFGLQGFKVDTAHEVEEAEKLIETKNYAVIIQDLRLGTTRNSDGLEIIRLVREKSPGTRVVVLTAYGSAEMEEEARRSGADAFLRKPKPLSQVAQVVQGLIESPPKQAAKSA